MSRGREPRRGAVSILRPLDKADLHARLAIGTHHESDPRDIRPVIGLQDARQFRSGKRFRIRVHDVDYGGAYMRVQSLVMPSASGAIDTGRMVLNFMVRVGAMRGLA